jgi:hypothetical protein
MAARITTGITLPYTERTRGEYRDLRQIELQIGKRHPQGGLIRPRVFRISLNGQYRTSKAAKAETRCWNPGFAVGFNRAFIEVVRFRRIGVHVSINVAKRGITFSAVRASI